MNEFLLAARQYWYLWVIFFVLCIVLIIVWKKAAGVAKKRFSRFNESLAAAEREEALSKRYESLSLELLLEDSPSDVISGIALKVQERLDGEPDIRKAFNELAEYEKRAYAMHYFFADSRERLSDFFRRNSAPLTPVALAAVRESSFLPARDIVLKLYPMLDEDNEGVSYDKKTVEELDQSYKSLDSEAFKAAIKEHIIALYNNQ